MGIYGESHPLASRQRPVSGMSAHGNGFQHAGRHSTDAAYSSAPADVSSI